MSLRECLIAANIQRIQDKLDQDEYIEDCPHNYLPTTQDGDKIKLQYPSRRHSREELIQFFEEEAAFRRNFNQQISLLSSLTNMTISEDELIRFYHEETAFRRSFDQHLSLMSSFTNITLSDDEDQKPKKSSCAKKIFS